MCIGQNTPRSVRQFSPGAAIALAKNALKSLPGCNCTGDQLTQVHRSLLSRHAFVQAGNISAPPVVLAESRNSEEALAPSNSPGTLVAASDTQPNGKKKHVKRPMNPFMVWGKEARKRLAAENPMATNGELSQALGRLWKGMSDEEKQPYVDEANRIKQQHRQEHPDYKYRPRRKPRLGCGSPTSTAGEPISLKRKADDDLSSDDTLSPLSKLARVENSPPCLDQWTTNRSPSVGSQDNSPLHSLGGSQASWSVSSGSALAAALRECSLGDLLNALSEKLAEASNSDGPPASLEGLGIQQPVSQLQSHEEHLLDPDGSDHCALPSDLASVDMGFWNDDDLMQSIALLNDDQMDVCRNMYLPNGPEKDSLIVHKACRPALQRKRLANDELLFTPHAAVLAGYFR